MGIKCPRCKSTKTKALAPEKMLCEKCSYSWKPYKHLGKKFKTIEDGTVFRKKKVMPGSKTETRGDGVILPKKRVKKDRKNRKFFDW